MTSCIFARQCPRCHPMDGIIGSWQTGDHLWEPANFFDPNSYRRPPFVLLILNLPIHDPSRLVTVWSKGSSCSLPHG